MNPTLQKEPGCIAIHFGTPNRALESSMPELFPPNNLLGALILHQMLKNALEREGVLATGIFGCVGELSDCVMLGEVTDEAAAVEIIKRELDRPLLRIFCQIAVGRDGEWQSVFPSAGARVNCLLDTERHEMTFEKFKAAILAWCDRTEADFNRLVATHTPANDTEREAIETQRRELFDSLQQTRASLKSQDPDQGNE
jgi:hypothetical protein